MVSDDLTLENRKPDKVPTTLRALIVLEKIAEAGVPVTPTEINQSLQLTKLGQLQALIDFRGGHGNARFGNFLQNDQSAQRGGHLVRLTVLQGQVIRYHRASPALSLAIVLV